MAERCLCKPDEMLLFACSGASNVGQIANRVAVELAQENAGRMFCLAGIGGHVSGIVESTKAAKRIVAIDGCPVQCARRTLEHAGFQVSDPVMVTDAGIKKSHSFDLNPEDVERVKATVRDLLERPA